MLRLLNLMGLVVALLVTSSAQAGPWMRSEKESSYGIGLTYETASRYWDDNSTLMPLGCKTDNRSLSLGYEYGWSYYHTLFSSADLKQRSCGTNEVSGLSDIELGLRGRIDIFSNGKTWEVAAIVPTGYSTTGPIHLDSGLYALRLSAFMSTGAGQRDRKLFTPVYDVSGDLKIWEGSASEQLATHLKVSLPVTAESSIYAGAGADMAITNRSASYDAASSSYRTYGYDKYTLKVGASTRLDKFWNMNIEMSNVMYGRNTGDTFSMGIHLSRNFKD